MNLTEDDKLKINNALSMLLMFVKIVMACFPFLVVPQKCDINVCTNEDKIVFWNLAFIPNLLSFVTFINLYYVQYTREMFLIDKFDEDDQVAEDELNNEIQKPEYKDIHNRVILLNERIKISNEICLYVFIANTMGSSLAILTKTYLDSTTFTVLLTNCMLIHSKIIQIKNVYHGDDLAISSVSIKQRVFNIIDKDISRKMEENTESSNDCFTGTQNEIATTIMQIH